jgi:hypothetical protein
VSSLATFSSRPPSWWMSSRCITACWCCLRCLCCRSSNGAGSMPRLSGGACSCGRGGRRTGGPAGQPRLLPAVRVPGQPHARYRDGPSGLGSARSGHGMPAVDVSDSDSRGTPRVTALPGSCALKAGYRRHLAPFQVSPSGAG